MAYKIVQRLPYSKVYTCDTEADISKLPTHTKQGAPQPDIDETTMQTTQPGSVATVIATGDTYLLQDEGDMWVKQPAGSSGGGGTGAQGRDGLDIVYCNSIAVTVGVSTVLPLSDFDIPADREINAGDLCMCNNGVIAKVNSVTDAGASVTGLFSMSGDGYVTSYEFTQATPSTDWVIQHNLGVLRPTITCYDIPDPGEEESEIVGDIRYETVNLAKVHFDVPVTGRAVVHG